MILQTPMALMSPTHKRSIIKDLQSAVTLLFSSDPEMYKCIRLPSIRAVTVVQRSLNLRPTTTSLAQALTLLGLLISPNSLPDLFEVVAQKFLAFRLTQPPPVDQTGLKVATWNVTALAPTEDHYKCRVLSNLARNHVVCVQETKMTAADTVLLEMQLPGCRVVATAAVDAQFAFGNSEETQSKAIQPEHSSNLQNLTSQASALGGVMKILPTYLCSTNCIQHVLIPGYALAVTIAHKSFQWCMVSV
jgi:hypothetical protein